MIANTKISRKNMIDTQLFTNQVSDKNVLEVMGIVPREEFVSADCKKTAYLDEDIDMGGGRSLCAPLTTARMLQAAELNGTEKVLEIGSLTGYTTCLLGMLVESVIAIDDSSKLLGSGSENLAKLGVNNAQFVKSDLHEGLQRQSPYDVIFINGKISELPLGIKAQLKDGGRIIAILENKDNPNGPGFISVISKKKNVFSCKTLHQACANYLPGFKKETDFTF